MRYGLMLLIVITVGFAFPDFTGYAGSPVSSGSCAASCHGGANSFTPTASGWPATYNPGQTYTITISHAGNTLSNFNACVLRQADNTPAGTLQNGVNTETYTHGGEGLAIHGSSNSQTSYTFDWQAPTPGVGTVILYVATHEGTTVGEPNGGGSFPSGQTGIEEQTSSLTSDFSFTLMGSNPNARQVSIRINVNKPSHMQLTAHTVTGEVVDVILDQYLSAGERIVTWTPKLGSGIYFLRLNSGTGIKEVEKVIVFK